MNMHLPYVSQWADGFYNFQIIKGMDPCCDPNWKVMSGFDDEDGYRFWSWKMCGIAAFRSYLLGVIDNVPSGYELLQLAIKSGAYVEQPGGKVKGLIYKPFCEALADKFNIIVEVETQLTLEKLISLLRRKIPLIASVSNSISMNGKASKQGGHLVICYGIDDDTIYFNDPASVNKAPYHSSMEIQRFYHYCSGRGMLLPAL